MGMRIEPARQSLQLLQIRRDRALRRRERRHARQHRLPAVPRVVLQAHPQALAGHVRRGQGFGLEGRESSRVRGVCAAAGYEGEEAGTVEGQGEREVVFGVRDARQAQPRAGGVLEVRAHVDDVD